MFESLVAQSDVRYGLASNRLLIPAITLFEPVRGVRIAISVCDKQLAQTHIGLIWAPTPGSMDLQEI